MRLSLGVHLSFTSIPMSGEGGKISPPNRHSCAIKGPTVGVFLLGKELFYKYSLLHSGNWFKQENFC